MSITCSLRLHQAFELVPEPGAQTTHEKQLLEDGDIAVGGLVIEAELATDLRKVEELGRQLDEDLDQPRHLSKLLDAGDLANIALDDGIDVGPAPVAPATLGGSR